MINNSTPVKITKRSGFAQKNNFILYRTIENTDADSLIHNLKSIFAIPYVNYAEPKKNNIKSIAIAAGFGDVVKWMKAAEQNGVDAYITGEIYCHINNEYGRKNIKK